MNAENVSLLDVSPRGADAAQLADPTHATAGSQRRPGLGTARFRLRTLAFMGIAGVVGEEPGSVEGEHRFLQDRRRELAAAGGHWEELLLTTLQEPNVTDEPLLTLAADLELSSLELLSVALAASVEDDALAGRVLARVQAPVGGARPTLGLLVTAFAATVPRGASPWAELLNGRALQSGLLQCHNETAPLPERSVTVPAPLCLALSGQFGNWPGVSLGPAASESVTLAASALADAARYARALCDPGLRTLVIRSGSGAGGEGRAAAAVVASAMGAKAVFVETDHFAGLGPWLRVSGAIPVFAWDLGPCERRTLPTLTGYDGAVLVLAGPEGRVESAGGAVASWTLPVPSVVERAALWRRALGDRNATLADELAIQHRHSAGRIAELGRLARHHASLRERVSSPASGLDGISGSELRRDDITRAAWEGESGGLESLAEPLRTPVTDAALVVPAALRAQLDLLRLRCRVRDNLVEGLGISAVTRYRPGVRALFTGPSGTGKTLAASWLATSLGLPLYRVDLASVTSKYIGETEKNLAQLLARAERAEVVLLFDEADSLFGKRTDIRDSNDRFANAQTNYLLQRIENYDGIVLLTSNSRARFDPAFARRLDCVLEFQLPSADERRELWLAHLGQHHHLSPVELNQLAALADLAGGHIRNAVLTAALLARERGRLIQWNDCVSGLEGEYRKLHRALPGELCPNTSC